MFVGVYNEKTDQTYIVDINLPQNLFEICNHITRIFFNNSCNNGSVKQGNRFIKTQTVAQCLIQYIYAFKLFLFL